MVKKRCPARARRANAPPMQPLLWLRQTPGPLTGAEVVGGRNARLSAPRNTGHRLYHRPQQVAACLAQPNPLSVAKRKCITKLFRPMGRPQTISQPQHIPNTNSTKQCGETNAKNGMRWASWASWQSPLTRRYSREPSESAIRAVQCCDCPTAPCGSRHDTEVGRAKSEIRRCSRWSSKKFLFKIVFHHNIYPTHTMTCMLLSAPPPQPLAGPPSTPPPPATPSRPP